MSTLSLKEILNFRVLSKTKVFWETIEIKFLIFVKSFSLILLSIKINPFLGDTSPLKIFITDFPQPLSPIIACILFLKIFI